MKTLIATIAMLAIGATALPSNAYAIGCMSGAAVGGVAGHVAGHHALLGAAAGCAVGHHEKVMARRRAEQQQQAPAQGYAPR